MITGNLNVIHDARVRTIISKGPKYRFPSNIDFPKCRREIAASLNDFSNRWCKRANVEPDALKNGRLTFLKLLILIFHFTLVIHIFYPPPPPQKKKKKKISEYDQEIPQSQTVDNPWHHEDEPLNHHKTPERQIK